MRSVTTAFRRALASGRRDYVSRATILLEDGTFMAVGVDSTLIAINDTNALKILSINADTFFSGVGSTEPGVYEFTYTSSRWRYNGTATTSLTPYGITVSGTVVSGDTITVYATVGYSNIWSNGISIDDAVSNDNVLEVGSAIVNKGTLVLNNIYDEFTPYDFSNAEVKMYVGLDDLDDGTDEEVLMKTVYVDDPGYNGSLITLSCLDNMSLFDKPYTESSLVYPATLKEVVLDACSECGVTLANTSQYFPNYNFEVDAPDIKEGTTFRQVLSWAAQIACCFARINSEGELEVRWYNTDAFLPGTETDLDGGQFDDGSPSYSSGDTADGGSFNPWNTGTAYDGGTFSTSKAYHVIPSSFSHQLSTDDVVITGVNVVIKTASDTSAEAFYTFSYGEPGYVISIENNGFIDGSNGQAIANFIGGVLVGLTFRKASITHLSDPTIEAGDVAYYFDSKDVKYKILVSSTRFSIDASQNTVSSAETPKKNSAVRYSESTRNYVELRKRMKKQQSDWQAAEEELSERIAAAGGLYESYGTNPATGSGQIIRYHDKPNIEDSEIVMLFTTAGFTLCSDYKTKTSQGLDPTWYGMTVDGTFLAGVIQTIALFFDYAHGGTLTLGGLNNTRGRLEILDASSNVSVLGDNSNFIFTAPVSQYSSTLGRTTILGHRLEMGTKAPEENDFTTDLYFRTTINYSTMKRQVLIDGYDTESFLIRNISLRATSSDSGISGYDSDHLTSDVGVSGLNGGGLSIGGDLIVYVGDTFLKKARIEKLKITDLAASNVKSRVATTENYNDRMLFCYETPTPYFGDIGTGITDENGEAFISIDDIFDETVNVGTEYCVFLQKEGPGDIWVDEKNHSFFIVKGTPNLKFSWELKAVQKGFETLRLDDYDVWKSDDIPEDDLEMQLNEELDEFDHAFGEAFTLDAELEAYDKETEELYA